jgi:nicotinate-nucleotide--dimethylbenzimidazole phosphoribosyltransferase
MPPSLEPFSDFASLRVLLQTLPALDQGAVEAARAHQAQLTKPPGALGRLEDLAVWMAGWQRTPNPTLDRVHVLIAAGNHGVAVQGVSAFPTEVTAQMVANFAAGGAAINQLARVAGATLDVLPLDLGQPTADFTQAPAMSQGECLRAFQAGFDAAPVDCDLLVLGEMGIANTTVAAALCAALVGGEPALWTGPGTGVDSSGVAHKADVIAAGLARHAALLYDPLETLAALGGRELAAMAGAILAARLRRIPVMLDGYVTGAAALVLHSLNPYALDHCLAGHCSAEPAHRRLLAHLGNEPLLDLGLRLGEGSGAALAVPILRAALATHNGMATFAQAGVSDAG